MKINSAILFPLVLLVFLGACNESDNSGAPKKTEHSELVQEPGNNEEPRQPGAESEPSKQAQNPATPEPTRQDGSATVPSSDSSADEPTAPQQSSWGAYIKGLAVSVLPKLAGNVVAYRAHKANFAAMNHMRSPLQNTAAFLLTGASTIMDLDRLGNLMGLWKSKISSMLGWVGGSLSMAQAAFSGATLTEKAAGAAASLVPATVMGYADQASAGLKDYFNPCAKIDSPEEYQRCLSYQQGVDHGEQLEWSIDLAATGSRVAGNLQALPGYWGNAKDELNNLNPEDFGIPQARAYAHKMGGAITALRGTWDFANGAWVVGLTKGMSGGFEFLTSNIQRGNWNSDPTSFNILVQAVLPENIRNALQKGGFIILNGPVFFNAVSLAHTAYGLATQAVLPAVLAQPAAIVCAGTCAVQLADLLMRTCGYTSGDANTGDPFVNLAADLTAAQMAAAAAANHADSVNGHLHNAAGCLSNALNQMGPNTPGFTVVTRAQVAVTAAQGENQLVLQNLNHVQLHLDDAQHHLVEAESQHNQALTAALIAQLAAAAAAGLVVLGAPASAIAAALLGTAASIAAGPSAAASNQAEQPLAITEQARLMIQNHFHVIYEIAHRNGDGAQDGFGGSVRQLPVNDNSDASLVVLELDVPSVSNFDRLSTPSSSQATLAGTGSSGVGAGGGAAAALPPSAEPTGN